MAVDITERKRAEAVRQAAFRIAEAANTAGSLADLLRLIHASVGELMPAENFYVALYDATTGTVSFPYFADEHDPPPAPRRLAHGLTEYVLRSNALLHATPEVAAELARRGEAEIVGTPPLDWIGVPLRAHDQTVGALVVQSYTEGVRFGDREIEILQFVSGEVAMAIERRRAEEDLSKSYELLHAVIEGVPDAIFVKDREGRFLTINSAAARLLGKPADEIVGRPESELFPLDAARWLESDRRILAGGQPETTEEIRVTAGDTRNLQVTKGPFRDRSGNDIGVIGVVRDITEGRRLADRLRQAERMEAIGQLAGGVAHDFNNILAAISSYSELVLESLDRDDARRADLEEILKAASRAATLTQQLLAFGRRQVLNPKVVDLNGLILETQGMLRRLIREDIELVTDLDPALGRVRVDPIQLQQILLNLTVNARDAMPSGGRLTLRTANAESDSMVTAERSIVHPGRYVLITVSDTGMGMDEATKARIFEPFFTTKEPGKGTGLGLATVYGIVKQSGGYIWAHSSPGKGSTFEVFLPRDDEPVSARDEPGAEAPRRGTETVLLVEGEEAARSAVRIALERYGYTVLEASDADGALALARERRGPIHLLLTDIVMPGMSGVVLADRLCPERPETRVLLMAGYGDEKIGRHGALDPGGDYLPKPFTPAKLARKVREVLDTPR